MITITRTPTGPQQRFVNTLLAERQVPDKPIRFATASYAIDYLKSLPYAVTSVADGRGGWVNSDAHGPARPRGALADLGLYRHDGSLFVVREFQPRGESGKVRFARELVPNDHSEADRANGLGDAVKMHAVKAPGMQYRLTPAEAVSLEEVAALGIQFGECLICGTPIETKASVVDRGGIGPVCHGRQTALLARRSG
jgi:hypothetical protein